jgi:hypothetical protein
MTIKLFAKTLATGVFGLCAGAALVATSTRPIDLKRGNIPPDELYKTSQAQLSAIPITCLNLSCARGLEAGTGPDVAECRSTVSSWAQHVRTETERHAYRFAQNPAEFENSENFFKMLMLAVVLTEDYNVHYDNQRKSAPDPAAASDGFFHEPKLVFLHGLLGPDRKGTCSSLPVLYVAVGRELGYPLKLVTTKAHMFVRWEGFGERFNIEVTGDHGLNRFPDDYYRHWPFEVSPAEEQAEGYLKSLTPPEELAVFLSIRGMCLRDLGRLAEAADAFAMASRLAPECRSYSQMFANLKSKQPPPQTPNKLNL